VPANCDRWLCNGVEKPLGTDFERQFQEAYERFANAGEQVLGFARLAQDARPADQLSASSVPTDAFIFIGLVSLVDPPKLGVDQAIADCRSAGIRNFMVTGDHALTAEAIAHKVGIITLPTRNDVAHERGVPLEEVDPDESDIQAVVIIGQELKHLIEAQ